VNGSDSLLELAVQARVTGGALGAFSFDIAIPGEADTNGTLERARINTSLSNHAYFNSGAWAAGTSIGVHGMAYPYTFLASTGGPSAAFNGVINTSTATFTNNPNDQEIGLIVGRVMGDPLLHTPGIGGDGDGVPDTYVSGTTAALDATAAANYFGAGQFIDVYRFRYTVTNLAPRNLSFIIRNVLAENFTQLTNNGNLWGAQDSTVASGDIHGAPLSATVTGFSLFIPSPATGAVLGMGGLVALRRRRSV
jgi:hypothetical protein